MKLLGLQSGDDYYVCRECRHPTVHSKWFVCDDVVSEISAEY